MKSHRLTFTKREPLPKYSTYDTITEAYVRIHAIEELQPSNHQKLHQHGRGLCPAYWQEPRPVGLGSGEGIHVADANAEYWRIYRPAVFLFESSVSGGPLSVRTAQAIFQHAKAASGVQKKVEVLTTLPSSKSLSQRHCPKDRLTAVGKPNCRAMTCPKKPKLHTLF